jgi:hypothetical protein
MDDTKPSSPVIVLRVGTVLRFLWLVLIGRRPRLLSVEAAVPAAQRLLQRLAERAVAAGRASWVLDECPQYHHVRDYFAGVFIYDIHATTLEMQDREFRIRNALARSPDYTTAYQLAVANFLRHRHLPILLLDAVIENAGPEPPALYGMTPELAALYDAYFGRALPKSVTVRASWIAVCANVALALTIGGFGIVWCLTHIRLSQTRRDPFFFAADYFSDPRDHRLYQHLEDGGPMLMVQRGRDWDATEVARERGYTVCNRTDGTWGAGMAAGAARMIVGDIWTFLSNMPTCPPELFYALAALPIRRARWRALFNRFPVKAFWGRDEYDPEHVMRRLELNRAGGRAFGIMHGTPTLAISQPQWSYISYDQFYMFGRGIYDAHLKPFFGPSSRVTAVGSFGARAEDYALVECDRPPNILVMLSVFAHEPAVHAIVDALAAAFPDRTVYLQVKFRFRPLASVRDAVRRLTETHANIVYTEDGLFELFRRARYTFSDPSTTVIESLQFGMTSFFMDVSPVHRSCYYREFPFLCVRGPDDAVSRIRDIESGAAIYRREDFGALVDLSGVPFWETVRRDLGLPAESD